MKKILIQLIAALSLTMSAFAVPHYHVTQITAGEADGINNKGDVVGQTAISTDYHTYFNGGHAFLYKSGKVIDLGVYPTQRQPVGDTTKGYAVNNSDLVVGSVYNADFLEIGSDTSDDFIFTWKDGKLTVFPYGSGNGGESSYATSINNQGNYAGTLDILTYDWAVGIHAIASYGVGQAFINRNGVFTPLGVLNPTAPIFDTYSIAYGMNDANQVVGLSTSPTTQYRGFLWMNGKMAAVGSTSFIPHAINDAGWIVGSDSNGASLYISGLTIKLGAGRALSLNNSGTVVGDILNSDNYTTSKAFIYVLGKRSDLTTLVDGGWTITGVGQINDFGQIAATGTKAGSTTTYALLLTPTLF
jgi:probable HAF family extracellular repeat protein